MLKTLLGVLLGLGAVSGAQAGTAPRDLPEGGCWISEATGRPLPDYVLERRDILVDPANPNRILMRGENPGAPAIAADREPCSRSAEPSREVGLDPAVLAEINAARADPAAYAARLRVYLHAFRGRIVEEPGRPQIMTVEGASAVEEAIDDLERRAPAPPLATNVALARVARSLLADQEASGRIGHVGSDGATLSERMRRAGVFAMGMEEDIAYGGSTPAEVVRQLIVDDGVRDRGHRQSLFDPHMDRAAVACGSHARWGSMCVVDMAGGMMPARGYDGGR
ncbi:MAG: CAP domain-containing protein [Caulobacteraceae bacterium]|nr:CAP domain-containing protein [Caulobacteraceae bacterium]